MSASSPSHTHGRARPAGAGYALGAALLFGVSTPLAKRLTQETDPILLAGLLYLGSGLGLALLRGLRRKPPAEAPLSRPDLPWLAASIVAGGIVAPVALMLGLASSPAASASLLLNVEGVLTALLAWIVFRESADRRLILGMCLIVAGGAVLSWRGAAGGLGLALGSLLVVLACLGWAIDNNLTRKVAASDPAEVTLWKGCLAGAVNLALAVSLGASLPAWWIVLGCLLLGFVSYGLSLVLFVLSLRHLGTARTGAYFALAPFVGAGASLLLLSEPVSAGFWPGLALMAAGVALHLSERHAHEHSHDALTHSHAHTHDEHHQHPHEDGFTGAGPHTHEHTHAPLTHAHPHFPDLHHRHTHPA